MNIYYIKQTKMPMVNKFYISDEKDNILFLAKSNGVLALADRILGGICSIGHDLNIMTFDGNNILSVKKQNSFLFEKFKLIKGDSVIAEVKQEKKIVKPIIKISFGKEIFNIECDIFEKEFCIKKNSVVCAKVSKTRLDIKDSYKLTIYNNDGNDEFYIALVLVIDSSFHNS